MLSAEGMLMMHKVWSNWTKVRRIIYRELGINSTEELITSIKNGRLTAERFLDIVIRRIDPDMLVGSLNVNETLVPSSSRLRLITIFDRDYPQELLNIQRVNDSIYPPLLLYVLTEQDVDFNARPIVSIVGTRSCTDEGAEMAYDVASRLCKRYTIASGLAKGIDYHATQGTLDNGGTMIEVRPYLLPVDYVKKEDYERIMHSGCILAENLHKIPYPSWIRMSLYLRNRIIAGIARAVIVIEARMRKGSGSMHQIEFALKRGKPVFVWKNAHMYNDKELIEGIKVYERKGAKVFRDIDELTALMAGIDSEPAHHQHHVQRQTDTPF